MALWPLSDFQRAQEGGSVSGSSTTVNAVAGAANVKGNYVEMIAATDADGYGLALDYIGTGTAAADASAVIDVAIGAAGAEVVIVPDLLIGSRPPAGSSAVYLPIRIPKGSRVAVRAASTTASKSVFLQGYVLSGGVVPGEAASVAESLGVGTVSGGTSSGTPTLANVKGPWVQLGTSTRSARFALLCPNKPSGTADTASANLLDLGIGAAGAELVLIANARANADATEVVKGSMLLVPCRLPSGTRFAIRHQGAAITAASIPRASVTLFS